VTATALSTELGAGRARVSTVEHLLAALHAGGHWTGLVVEVDGPELPILDGSALGWARLLENLEPEAAPPSLVPPRELALEVRGGYVGLEPAPALSLSVRVAYLHPAIGEQGWAGGPERWAELLDARTFGFERDLERLWSRAGPSAPGKTTPSSTARRPQLPPRGRDEVVRHKALDLLGDLYLAGAPLAARVVAERASHEAHVALALALRGP
jgi:UDP-3-O-[3-hydroxymyristoyl] N-acetylglucosamine deacetylase